MSTHPTAPLAQADVRRLPLAAASVGLIFTDPPYPTRYLCTYAWLAGEAARVLKPGGWLVCMAGGLNLNRIFRIFDRAGLRYFFTMALVSTGNAPLVWRRVAGRSYPIVARAKHLLVYSKGPALPDIGGVLNLFEGGAGWSASKRYHHWGQDVNTCRYYIEHFSRPNDLIVDPFVGGGTTLVAARLARRRRVVGLDIDPQALRAAQQRLADTHIPEQLPLFAGAVERRSRSGGPL